MAFVIVNGEVSNVFYEGKGLKIKETFKKRDGSEGASYYSAFFEEPHGLNVGDTAKFSGLLGLKGRTYEKQDGSTGVAADATLNNAKAEDVSSGGGGAEYVDSSPF